MTLGQSPHQSEGNLHYEAKREGQSQRTLIVLISVLDELRSLHRLTETEGVDANEIAKAEREFINVAPF